MKVTRRLSPGFSVTRSMPRNSLRERDSLRIDGTHIQLHHFIARARADVLDLHADLNLAVVRSVVTVESQIRVLEARIRQAVSERIERLAVEVAVRAALHVVVVERRQLLARLVEGDRQAARRDSTAPNSTSATAVPATLSRIPRHQDRGQHAPAPSPRPARSPPVSTSTTGLPVACSASSSFCCVAGRRRSVRSPPAKPGIAHLHFLAFDVAGEAADKDDRVGRRVPLRALRRMASWRPADATRGALRRRGCLRSTRACRS